jgi:hypothetical protein
MASKKKDTRMGTEEMFEMLHGLLTKELIERIESGEATTADLRAAIDWLAKNDISGVAYDGNPLDKLQSIMPKVDPELVRQRMMR